MRIWRGRLTRKRVRTMSGKRPWRKRSLRYLSTAEKRARTMKTQRWTTALTKMRKAAARV